MYKGVVCGLLQVNNPGLDFMKTAKEMLRLSVGPPPQYIIDIVDPNPRKWPRRI